MNGNELSNVCPKCKATLDPRGKALTIAMTCPKCNTYFCRGNWNDQLVNFSEKADPILPIGKRGKINDVQWEVMGFVVKRERVYKYKWHEYLLFNPYKGYAYLSQYDGHWNFITPVEDDPRQVQLDSVRSFVDGDREFNIYQKYHANVMYAKGEFFFDVFEVTESTFNFEYISPPYLYGLEKNSDSLLWYEGEYIYSSEVAKAFNLHRSSFPSRAGVGYTQPISTTIPKAPLFLASIGLVVLLLLLQIFFASSSKEKNVFHQTFTEKDLGDQKFFKTESFYLEGGTKSVEVDIYAPISNEWFFAEFSLINDTDGTEYNFTKEFDYYFGVDEGYAWSEGTTSGEAFLSSIPEGKYHINIYPDFTTVNREFRIDVIRDVHSSMNFMLAMLALGIFPLAFYIRNNYFERQRWADSDYSPYDTE